MAKMSLFTKVVLKGFTGAFLGVISGALLGLLIYYINLLFHSIQAAQNAMSYGYSSGPDLMQIGFFAMGFGAVIGGVSGVVATVKEASGKKLF